MATLTKPQPAEVIQTCSNCNVLRTNAEGRPTCKLNPPGYFEPQPQVSLGDWCGQWAAILTVTL